MIRSVTIRFSLRLLFAVTLGLPVAGRMALGNDLDQLPRYYEKLRERGLFAVGERYALNRLEDSRLPPAERAQLVIELSRCYEAHARVVDSQSEQQHLQQLADEILAELLANPADFPRRAAVEFQRLVLAAERASAHAWEATIEPDIADLSWDATSTITSTIEALDKWSAAAGERRSAQPASSQAVDGELPPRERRRMRREAEVRAALLSIELAEVGLTPVERASAIVSAEVRLAKLKKAGPDPVWDWPLRMAALRLARLEGNGPAFTALLRQYMAANPAPETRATIVAEQVRQLLENAEPEKALRLLSEQAGEGKLVTDELRSLQVQVLLAHWEKADPEKKKSLWVSAEEQQARITSAWGRRSAAAIDRARDVSEFGEPAAKLVRAARAAYRNGDRQGSARFYQQARAAALKEARNDAADDLAMFAASILFEDGDHRAAVEACRPLVAAGDGPRAPQASLLTAYCLGRIADAQPSVNADQDYEQALIEHLKRFDQDVTVGDAAWMLGLFQEQQGRPSAALDALSRIAADHARFQPAMQRRAELLAAALESLRRSSDADLDGRTRSDWASAAASVIEEARQNLPSGAASFDSSQASLAVAVARLELLADPPQYRAADELLDRVISMFEAEARQSAAESRDLDPTWTEVEQQARAMRVVSLAGQQRFAEAEARLKSLSNDDSDELLAVFSGLSGASTGLSPADRDKLGQIELSALDRLNTRRAEFSPAEQRRLDEARAAALAATDKTSEAIDLYEALLKDDSTNTRMVRTLAQLLDSRGRPEDVQIARAWWQRLERLNEPGSAAWLEARHAIAAGFLKEGRAAEARKLIAVTRIVYPDLGGGEWKRRFKELEDAAGRTPARK